MSLIIPANSAAAGGGYDVANSCMFNVGDDAKLSRTAPNSSATHDDKFTFSFWVKRSVLGAEQQIYSTFDGGGAPYQEFQFYFQETDKLRIQTHNSSNLMELIPTRLFRDVSAWYHFVFAYDSSQGTASNRAKLYVNGTQETSFSTETYPDQNTDGEFAIQNHIQAIGNNTANNRDSGLYLTEVVGVDGQALAPTEFGEFDGDSGIWKPKDVSEINVGTLGFYLDFEDSSALGNDVSGVGDFTVSNLAATDQGTDTCTNNFVTLNRLDTHASATLSQGNTGIATTAGGWYGGSATMGITLGQSLYFEAKAISTARLYFGLSRIGQGVRGTALNNAAEGDANFDYMWRTTSANSVWYGGSDQSITIAATSANDICACRVNTDGQVIFYKNDAVVVTYSTTLVAGYTYFPILSVNAYGGGTESWLGNFGNPSYAITSSNTDPDG